MTQTFNHVEVVIARPADPKASSTAVRDAGDVAVHGQVERPAPGFAGPPWIRTLVGVNTDFKKCFRYPDLTQTQHIATNLRAH